MASAASSVRLLWTALAGFLWAAPLPARAEAEPAAAAGHEHCHPAAPAGGGSGRTDGRLAADGEGYRRSEQPYRLPEVTLVDEAGRRVRLAEALPEDEPVMLNFIFTTCQAICPVMSRIFARVPEELGAEAGRVRLVSISIDPEQDTPQRLRAYAERFGAGPRWRFLTGSIGDIEAVERAFDVYRGDKMNHQPLTLLRTGAGRPWLRLEGFASPADLAREYQRLAAR